MVGNRTLGSLRPTPRQELLLSAVLADTQEALREAWTSWSHSVHIAELDPNSCTLLPLLFLRLEAGGGEEVIPSQLTGSYRHAWTRNQSVLHAVRPFLESCAAQDVPTMLIRGAAYLLDVYPDMGSRPMNNVEVLVEPAKAQIIIDELRAEGWTGSNRADQASLSLGLPFRFTRPGGLAVDVRTQLLWEGSPGEWEGHRSVQWEDVSFQVPAPTVQMLNILVYGLTTVHHPPLRWIVDATLLWRAHADDIDWPLLCRLAESIHVGYKVSASVGYLQQRGWVALTETATKAVEQLAWAEAETRAYSRQSRFQPHVGSFVSLWQAASQREADPLEVMASVYGLNGIHQLPGHLVKAAWRRRRDPMKKYRA